jgi:hypothetical protein
MKSYLRKLLIVFMLFLLLGVLPLARQATAAASRSVACSITLGPQPELVYMHVDGLDPKAGTSLNSLGGIKNYYFIVLNGPIGQEVHGAILTTSIIMPFNWQGPGHYEGIVYWVLDPGRWIKLTEKATCSADFS